MTVLDCKTLEEEVQSGAILLDVRSEQEWQQARLPGATLIPVNRLAEVQNKIAPGSKILAYCRSGQRSEWAANQLKAWGYDAMNIGGVMHYMQCIEY